MKRLFLVLLSFLIAAVMVRAQGDSYYYKYKQQKFMTKDPSRLTIKLSEAKGLREAKSILASVPELDLQKTVEVGRGVFRVNLQQGTTPQSAIIKLKSLAGVASVNPLYVTRDEAAEIYLTDEVCLQFANGTALRDIQKLFSTYNLTVRRSLAAEPYYLLEVPRSASALDVANAISREPSVLFAHPNFYTDILKRTYVPGDRWFDRQFYLYNHGQRTRWGTGTPGADIKAVQAWDITRGSSSILVSDIDDGQDLTHEDFNAANRVPGYDFADHDPSVQPVGENAHGTNTAGIIGAAHNGIGVAGISPNSRLQMMKIFTDAGGGSSSDDLAWAIDSAWSVGADVLSNSWGYSSTDTNLVPVVRQAILRAKTLGRNGKGCVVVFAAGNTADRPGDVGIITFPGSMSEVITVGASDRNDQVAFYSPNSNPAGNLFIELTAPSHRAYDSQISTEGFEVWSTDISGSAGYNAGTADTLAGDVAGNYDGSMGGTSAACPQVSGAAALILSVNPNLTSNQVTQLLTSTADTVGGYNYHAVAGRPGASLELGYGRLNMYRALIQAGANFGWVKGTITNVVGGSPISGAAVDFVQSIPQAGGTSSTAGLYYAAAQVDTPGTTRNVTLRARKFGFRDTTMSVTITRNDTTTRNFAMTPVANGTLVIRTVRRDSSNIRSGVSILFNGTQVASGNTDSTTGLFSTILPLGTYDVLLDPPSPYANRRFNGVTVASGNNPLYVVVRAVVENSPAAMRDTLTVGQVHAKTLVLTNTTTDSVVYRLSDDVTASKARFGRIAVQPRTAPIYATERPKGSAEPMGVRQGDSQGGPDTFGYRWIDSDEPGGPAFNWFNIDTAGRGTAVTFTSLDDGNTSVPLAIPFPFYGNTYSTTLNLCTNGWMSFTSTSTAYSNVAIPASAEPNNAIYPMWDDLNLTSGGNVKYYYDAPNTRFIVQYTNVPFYSGTGTSTFQVILYPNGQILVQYLSMTGTYTSCTVGIENADGTVALQVAYNAAYLHSNLALKFYLPDAPWISEAPSFGTLAPNSSSNVVVTFDANGLLQGTTYPGKIVMDAVHPDVVGSIVIPASLRVINATQPTISINPTSVSFPTTIIGNTRRDSVRVRNVGTGVLTISSVTSSSPRFAATITSTSLNTGDSARIRVAYTPTIPAGSDTGRIIVLSNDAANPRVDILLNGTSLGAPLFRARVDSLVRPTMVAGSTDSIRFYVRNAGTSASPYAARAYMYPRTDAPGKEVEIPVTLTPVNPYASTTMASTPAVGLAPRSNKPAKAGEPTVGDVLRLIGENAFAADVNTSTSTGYVDKFNLATPGTFVNLGTSATTYSFAGDFGSDGVWYAITYPDNNLIRIDTTTGAFTTIGLCTPANAETWTVLEVDPTSGQAYGISAGTSSSTWYTVNLTTGAATVIGTITGAPNMISGAFDNSGQFYGLEQSLDNLVRIDKATGVATVIGAAGFDARYAQDADFDRTTNTLYLAAYNFTLGAAELRTANLTTGATTLIGAFPTSTEVTNLAINSPTGPSANWLTIAPTSGGPININDSTLFTARFDATSPVVYNNPGNFYGRIEINPTVTPVPDTLKLPVRMFVVPSPNARLVVQPDSVNIGNVEIGRTDSAKTILVKNIGGSTLTVTNATFTGGTGFSLSRTSFTLNSLDTLRIKVKFTAAAPGGVRTARLNWTSNDPGAQSFGVRAVSVGVAHVAIRPDTFYVSRGATPDTTFTSFKIYSTGTDTLRYRISEATSLVLDEAALRSIERSKTQQPAARPGKGVVDPTPGEGGFDGQGGPDSFGYRWIDSDEPGGPSYNWVDISTVGTAITFSSLDDGNTNVPFPFTFNYYGIPYSGSINVCTNGWLSFTSTATAYSNSAIPSTTAPLGGIFPFWDDMNLTSGGNVYYYNDAANGRFIVEYLNVPHYSTGELYTFEVILKSDGSILYQYQSMTSTLLNSSTVGIQNETGTIGLQVVYNSTYIHDNLALLITSDILPWMSTNKTEGVVGPGDSTTVALRVHPFGMSQGLYTGYQKVRGNTPDTTANVRVRLNVLPSSNSVTVTSPNGGESWAVGSTQSITWLKTGTVDTVKIEYSTTGNGGPWTLINAGVPAKVGLEKHPKLNTRYIEGGEWDNPNGTFSWLIPNTLSTNCYVKITQKSNSSVTDVSNAAFTIRAAGNDTSWTVQTSGTANQLYAVKAISQNVAWAAGVGGVVVRTTNAGVTWTAAGTLGTDIYTMTAVDANTAIVGTSPTTGAAKLWKTTNGGTTWVAKDSTGIFWDYVHMFDANNGYALGDPPAANQNWVLKKTTNGGENWVDAATVPGGATPEGGWNNSMMWLSNTTGWYGTNASKIYRTTDGGATWTGAATNLTNANSFAVQFNALTNGLAASQTGTMNKSTDGGATWVTGPTALTAAVYSLWGNLGSNEFWAVAGNNVSYSSNSGTTWTTSPKNGYAGATALNHFNAVKVGNDIYGWASGASGTIVRFIRIASGVEDQQAALPTTFALSQNYPNPFNPTTKIKFDLPEQANVVLKVYNVLGQEVATLFNGQQSAGYHEVNWDGRANFGAAVSSGVYFYRFEATSASGQTFSSLKKMMFLK